MQNFMETILIVSIGLFLSHFVRFRTIELSVVTSKLVKKVQMEKESNSSLGGTIILLALFAQRYTTE